MLSSRNVASSKGRWYPVPSTAPKAVSKAVPDWNTGLAERSPK